MGDLEITLNLKLETPVSVGGAGVTGTEADKMVQRDARGYPIIPASQIKGRLRHTCEALARELDIPLCSPPHPETTCPHTDQVPRGPDGQRLCLICRIFGSPAHPGPLRFSDLSHQPLGEDSAIRPGIGVDRRRGTVQEKLLFLTETVLAGAEFTRSGPAIAGRLDREAGLFLLAALQAIQSWGGAKSRGLGWATVDANAIFDGEALDLAREKEVLAQWLQRHQSQR